MKRFRQILVVVAVVAVAVLATRYIRHQNARSTALPVVAELGGKVGSITAPLGGTEYFISFAGRTLKRNDIDRLAVLKVLARNGNYISLSLKDATISDADRGYLQQTLPEVHVLPAETNSVQEPAVNPGVATDPRASQRLTCDFLNDYSAYNPTTDTDGQLSFGVRRIS